MHFIFQIVPDVFVQLNECWVKAQFGWHPWAWQGDDMLCFNPCRPLRKNDDAIGQGYRFGQVMGNKHNRSLGGLPQGQNVGLQHFPGKDIQRGKGLVMKMISGPMAKILMTSTRLRIPPDS